MKEKELERLMFDLVKKEMIIFKTPAHLYEMTKSILSDTSSIPFVVGHKDWDKNTWKMLYLQPRTQSDRITVENFLEGMRKVKLAYKAMEDKKGFKGSIIVEEINALHYSNDYQSIISIDMSHEGAGYCLQIYNDGEKRFAAKSGKCELSRLEKIMDNHIGPCREYKK